MNRIMNYIKETRLKIIWIQSLKKSCSKIENLAQNPRLGQVLFTKKNMENIIDYFSVQFTLYNVYLFYVNSKGPKYNNLKRGRP